MEVKREKVEYVHSQVLKIREEDLHIGEDIGERSLSGRKDEKKDESCDNKKAVNGGGFSQRLRRVATAVDVVLLTSRPILPCSPLSGKTAVKASP